MCGICGWIGNRVDEKVIKEMMGALSHRGPDDEGYYKWEVGSGKWEVVGYLFELNPYHLILNP